MRAGEGVFVDTGAWVALALIRDPYHERACLAWQELLDSGARHHTSIPIIPETFTFLDSWIPGQVCGPGRRSDLEGRPLGGPVLADTRVHPRGISNANSQRTESRGTI